MLFKNNLVKDLGKRAYILYFFSLFLFKLSICFIFSNYRFVLIDNNLIIIMINN